MSSKKRALIELAVLLLNIVVATAFFKLDLDRQIAGVLAGICFLAVPIWIIRMETRWGRGQRSLAWWLSILFLSVCAIPILVLRLVFWGRSFDQIGYWSITGTQIHHFSQYLYIALVLAVIIEGLRKDHTY